VLDVDYELDDRYTADRGRVYLTGTQALVRLPLMQRRRDLAAGLRTAGFVSGYRGSPLGNLDRAYEQAANLLDASDVRFEPGVNEDLAATAVLGSQQADLVPSPRFDGVFALWYGKGPGVDRSCDALKHGNHAGAARHGGVLVLAGDDPGAKSSSLAHQSEHALVHCGIPVLNPATVQEYLDLGLLGWAMSRYSGCWVAMKCVTDTVESAASVEVDPGRLVIRGPEGLEPPEGGLNVTWAGPPLEMEARLFRHRLPAAQAFARANGIDRTVLDGDRRRLGVVAAGKAYLDLRQALADLGLDEERSAAAGLSVRKLGMTWPLEPDGTREFADGLEEMLVVEEKRNLVEDQLARLLYNQDARPRLAGKRDLDGASLVPAEGELDPTTLADVLERWLGRVTPELELRRVARPIRVLPTDGGLHRLPAFCSGCPHNASTRVPEGSVAQGGIGCHGMAVWMPDRPTLSYTHMGGEGANWIGQAPFTDTPHIFQNMGDGTYFHSGLLAIRAAVAAGVNITFKILANGAVAMTGGQEIEGESIEPEVLVPDIVRQLVAEGVRRVVVVTDDPRRYRRVRGLPADVKVRHRDELDRVQRELGSLEGVTALVYDQTCAAEARRLRQRGEFPEPDRRVVINELLCEGCGDCSVQSNCISIEPTETPFGRKRRINQSSCNKDYTCVKGYCPSFAVIEGGRLKRSDAVLGADIHDELEALPPPTPPDTATAYNVLVAGIGGSGVVTVGALIGMAAHLEGRGCSVLDVTGLAQKNGPVTSHVRIADDPAGLHSTRLPTASADLLVGCDVVVASAPDVVSRMSDDRTTAVVNTHVAPTSDFATHPDLDLTSSTMERRISAAVRDGGYHAIPATEIATALFGDSIATNLFLLGYAFQLGRLPVSAEGLDRAVVLNGRAVDLNRRAFGWGRLAAARPELVERALVGSHRSDEEPEELTLEGVVAARERFLRSYQSARYAQRYRALVERVADKETDLGLGDRLAGAVAHYYFKLLARKDEYEVARLWTDGSFRRQLADEFEGDYRIRVQLAPPFLPRDPDTGRVKKRSLGPWFLVVMWVLARLRFLRDTPFDVFGWSEHRRLERQLVSDYEATIDELLAGLGADTHGLAVEIASVPEHVRGFDLVKEAQLEEARTLEQQLLDEFREAAAGGATAGGATAVREEQVTEAQ